MPNLFAKKQVKKKLHKKCKFKCKVGDRSPPFQYLLHLVVVEGATPFP